MKAVKAPGACAGRALVEARRRVLLVQRTGWGKSAVYFITMRPLRDRGTGPTILLSQPTAC